MSLLKTKWGKRITYAIGGFLLFFIGVGIGGSGMEIQLKEGKVTLEELQTKTTKAKKDYNEITDILKKAEATITKGEELEGSIATLTEELNEKESLLQLEKNKIQDELKNEQSQLEDIKTQISAKKTELERLKKGIVAENEKPKKLPAGHFTVSDDIQPGRYKVTGTGSGNFFVNDGRKANVILGSNYGVKEYVVTLEDGDTIEATLPTQYQPIK